MTSPPVPTRPAWSFETVFQQSTTAFAVLDLAGGWLEVNAAAERLLGCARSALTGGSVFDLCSAGDARVLAERLERARAGALRAFTFDVEHVDAADGGPASRWLRLRMSAVGPPQGAPDYFVASIDDVSGEHRDQDERYPFFTLSPDPAAVASTDGYLLRVNPAWERVLGWSGEELRARPYIDFIHPDDRDRTIAEGASVLAGTPTANFRNRYRTRAGSYRWLEWQSRLEPGGDRIYCAARDVTEQQQALLIFQADMKRRHAALDAAEQRLVAHVNNTPLAVIEFDAGFRVRRWSTRAQDIFGWSEYEVVGERPDQWRFIHEDDADVVATAMQMLLGGDSGSSTLRNRNYTRDGGVVHCEWFNSAVFDDAGRMVSILSFAQDITAQVEAQCESEEREALFRATFEQAPVGIAHVALDGRWLRVNQTLCTFLGYDAEAARALTFAKIAHPDDTDSDATPMRRLLAGRLEHYEVRKRYLHRDGTPLWAQLTVSVRRDATGTPLHYIAVVEDIAATVAAEAGLAVARDQLEARVIERTRELEGANRTLAVEAEQRRGAENALRESELRIRAILENSHDAFIATEQDGRISEWNRSAEAIFGWRRSEVIGRLLGDVIVPPSLRAAHREGFARYLATGEQHILGQRLKLPARHRKGHDFPVELTISVVRLGGRQLFSAFLQDISERSRAEDELRASEARLRTITDNVPALIAHVDRNLRYTFNNATYREWFGQEPTLLRGRTIRETIGDASYGRAHPYMLRVLDGEQVSFDTEFPSSDGSVRSAHATYTPDFDADGQVQGFYITASDVSAHVRLAQVMEQRALRDELTGLPNRAAWAQLLDEGLARDERAGRPAAVMFLDLDGFKQINDEHGHEVGDAVLREFARRLRASVREGDTVARLAGDEFVVLLDDFSGTAEGAEVVARKVLEAMRAPFHVGGAPLQLASSIGVAVQQPGAFDRVALMRRADQAMYAAKRSGVGRYQVVEA